MTKTSTTTRMPRTAWRALGLAALIAAGACAADPATENGSGGSGASGVIQTGFHFNDFTVFSFPNGYSSDPTITALKDDPKVTLYDLAGNLVWGTEPAPCAAGDAAACP